MFTFMLSSFKSKLLIASNKSSIPLFLFILPRKPITNSFVSISFGEFLFTQYGMTTVFKEGFKLYIHCFTSSEIAIIDDEFPQNLDSLFINIFRKILLNLLFSK